MEFIDGTKDLAPLGKGRGFLQVKGTMQQVDQGAPQHIDGGIIHFS